MKLPLALLAGLTFSSAGLAQQTERPNIIFVFIDDMGFADPSCFGNPLMKTPNIDRLASEGIKLTNFYVNSPICSASRVAVTTGQYQARWKIHSYLNTRAGNADRSMVDYLDREAPTTAKKLKSVGYATAHFGKWHMGGGRDVDDAPLPVEYGFDESLVSFEGLGDRIISNPKGIERAEALGRGKVIPCKRWERIRIQVDRTLDFIRRHREGPFYVRLFPNDVHDAHVPIPGTVAKYAELSERANVQNFLAVLAELDRQLGRVIDEIDELGLAEKTLIIFTSDNGPTDWPRVYTNGGRPAGFTGPFFGRKWSLFEGGIRMPFIARWEGTIPPGAQDDESVMSGIDISPTLCSFAGVEVEEDLDGVDRSRVLLGEPMPRGKPVFWQYGHPHAVLQGGKPEHQSPTFAMREGPWKLLVNPDGSEARLFHLVKDPGEKTNLLEENHARASDMALRVRRWAAEMGLYSPGYDGLRPPGPTMAISTGGQLLRFVNHGVAGESGRLQFDGKSWLDLPEFRVPKIAGGRQLQVKARVTSEADDGVILAHGDSRDGYSVYLEGGKLAFATRVNGERRILMTPEAVPQPFTFEANWKVQGEMFLKLGRKIVARGKSAGILAREPEERMQIGADLGRPVGSVGGLDESGRTTLGIFQGSIENLTFRYPRGK